MGHYEELGVARSATHDEIKRAYYRQARRHHPDAHSQAPAAIQDSARRVMVEINAAWAVLGDPDRRRQYDAELAPRPGSTPATASGPDGTSSAEDDAPWRSDYPDWFDPDDQVAAAHLAEDVHEGPARRGEMLVFVPVGLAALAVATFAGALVLQWPALFAVSFALVPLALVCFLAAPFVAMAIRVRTPPARD